MLDLVRAAACVIVGVGFRGDDDGNCLLWSCLRGLPHTLTGGFADRLCNARGHASTSCCCHCSHASQAPRHLLPFYIRPLTRVSLLTPPLMIRKHILLFLISPLARLSIPFDLPCLGDTTQPLPERRHASREPLRRAVKQFLRRRRPSNRTAHRRHETIIFAFFAWRWWICLRRHAVGQVAPEFSIARLARSRVIRRCFAAFRTRRRWTRW